MVLCGDDLSADINDTDPQDTGVRPLDPYPRSAAANKTAELVSEWIAEASKMLHGQRDANMVTLRGFSNNPGLETFGKRYQMSAGCVAVYPMYRGIATLVGMETIQFDGVSPEDQFRAVTKAIVSNNYDFVFVHVKQTDSYGEDGNYDAKVKAIEAISVLSIKME
jgi:2,3-bisphosphoglycerate-independent phosphoglycerate mutase